MSSRKFSARAQRLEVLTFRQHFNNVWQRIICSSFETPADAAVFFGVDPSTAENWFEGRNAPQGWGVAWLISHPETREATLAALAGA
ncbi:MULTISPECIES: hypothetical protein [Paracoccus]|uniref:hypothetical protein n=1 Tax=Paracoccus TaxID=265 RepID=UPI00091FE924|nr:MULTISPECIES: hypothetical protein [Paracoccus]MBT0779572.1 hypothetical protein [Paracoccus sp. pheM1]UFS65296.1 hypothetical protein LO749_01630 [Paracoccus denitrificans]SFY23107.1 hypothetical protein SAMN04244548_03174 [Paracoccus pantotrophus]